MVKLDRFLNGQNFLITMPARYPTTYLSHVPTSIRDSSLVAFVILESRNPSPSQGAPVMVLEEKAQFRKPERIRTLYYVGGKNEQELWHSKGVLDYILQKTTNIAAMYDQVSFEKGKQVFDAIVHDYNNSGNYTQRRFNFSQRMIDYARHFSKPARPSQGFHRLS